MGFDLGIGEAALASAVSASAGLTGEAAIGAETTALAGATSAAASSSALASTLSSLSKAGSVLGGVTGAFGAINSAAATGNAARYQAQVAENNAALAKGNAMQAEAAGSTSIEAEALKKKALIGGIKASQAASNIDVNSGSALDVRTSEADLSALDALTIRSNAEKQAYGYNTAATGFGGQAQMDMATANQAPIAGAINAGSSLITGATGVADKYLKWQLASGSGNGVTTLFNP